MITQPASQNRPRFLLTNSLWLLIGRGGSQALALLMTIIVARSLGDVGLGQLTIVLTIVFIGNVFSTFGLDTLLIRAVAREPGTAPLTAVWTVQTALSLLFIAGVWLFAPDSVTGTGMRIYVLSLIPLAATTVFNAVLRAREQMNLYTSLQLFGAGCRLAVVAGLIVSGAGFLALIWGLLICQVLEAIATGYVTNQRLLKSAGHGVSSWFQRQFGSPRDRHSVIPILHNTFKAGLTLATLTLFAILYQRVAILILAQFGDAGGTGQFSAVMRLVDIPRMIPYALAGALFPSLARGETESRSGRWFMILALGSVGLALLIQPLAPWLVQLVFGDGYLQAATTLPILAWTLIPFVGVLYGSFTLVARNQERQVMMAHAVALLTAIWLGILGLQRWDLSGLALALVVTECIHATLLLVLVKRGIHAPS